LIQFRFKSSLKYPKSLLKLFPISCDRIFEMSKAIVIFLCFAGVCITQGQYLLTPAFIQGRSDLVSSITNWYEKLDTAYINLYESGKKTIDGSLAKYSDIRTKLNSAWNLFPREGVSETTLTNMETLINKIIEIIQNDGSYALRYSVYISYNLRTELSQQLDSYLGSGLNSVLYYLVGNSQQINTEQCVSDTIAAIITAYEPFANALLNRASNATNYLPIFFAPLKNSVRNDAIDLNALIKKINTCAKSQSRGSCLDEIKSEYDDNFVYKLRKPFDTDISTGIQAVRESVIYPSWDYNWYTDFSNALQKVSFICATTPY